MNRATRDKFVAQTSRDITAGNACWETPPAIYAELHQRFSFDIDLTANAVNHLSPVWFGPGSPHAEDALNANWLGHGYVGFSNPPYGRFVAPMLACAEHWMRRGFRTVLLLPLRANQAFRTHVVGQRDNRFARHGASELYFCDKRITFYEGGKPRINPRTQKPDGALFDSIIVDFDPARRGKPLQASVWSVPVHV